MTGAAAYEEIKRVTEEGAEAIGLAIACSHCAWRIERRLRGGAEIARAAIGAPNVDPLPFSLRAA